MSEKINRKENALALIIVVRKLQFIPETIRQPAVAYLYRMETERPVVLFDGVCNFCNRMVNFAIRNDPKARLRFAALQSAAGKMLVEKYGVDPDADTVVLIEKGKAFTYAVAAIRICRYLRWPVKLLYGFVIVPSFISQPLYKWFAKRRYKWFGKKETCMVPGAGIRSRFLE